MHTDANCERASAAPADGDRTCRRSAPESVRSERGASGKRSATGRVLECEEADDGPSTDSSKPFVTSITVVTGVPRETISKSDRAAITQCGRCCGVRVYSERLTQCRVNTQLLSRFAARRPLDSITLAVSDIAPRRMLKGISIRSRRTPSRSPPRPPPTISTVGEPCSSTVWYVIFLCL